MFINFKNVFWGSILPVALASHGSASEIFNYGMIISTLIIGCSIRKFPFLSTTNGHYLINSLVSILCQLRSKPARSFNTLIFIFIHMFSAMISGFILNFRFPRSFKTGELVLLSQLIGYWTINCFENNFKGWPSFFLLINFFPLLLLSPNNHSKWILQLSGCVLFAGLLALNQLLLTDLIESILTQKKILFYWTIGLILIILLPKFKFFSLSSQNSIRKFYHFAAVALFIPAAFWSLNVLEIGMACAATLFLLIELMRIISLSTNSKSRFKIFFILDQFMEKFRNELDEGDMILSHLYLLIGCAIPIWLNSLKLNNNKVNDLSNFSGIISLGIGDSLASISGKMFGMNKWNKNILKTIEGSICGCIGMFVSWILLNYFSSNHFPISIFRLLILSIASSVWEALITLNDNLTLPIFTFILIKHL